MRIVLSLLVWLVLLTPATAAPSLDPEAGSMRCGRSLVEVGDEAFILLDKCGNPDFRQVVSIGTYTDAAQTRSGKRRFRAEDRAALVTEEWVYRQGRGRLAKILTVTGGVLTSIRVSGRQ